MDKENGVIGMHAGAQAPIFQMAEKLRSNMTGPERILWEHLRLKPGGYKFRRQHPFGTYVLDFYCHRAKLSIEVDGESHNSQKQKEYDENRTNFLRDMGIKEIRFKNQQVIENLHSVVEEIELALRADSLEGMKGHAKAKKL